MLTGWFSYFIVGWATLMLGLMSIGGFFMFRKFLKRMPKGDGKSDLEWEEYYVNASLHLWGDDAKRLLYRLVDPVPSLFRDVAKQKIASRIAEIALSQDAKSITNEHIIEGYITATPKRDHKFLKKALRNEGIDPDKYSLFFER
ncbi:MAG: DUF2621 family protein [Bacilli bacterium]